MYLRVTFVDPVYRYQTPRIESYVMEVADNRAKPAIECLKTTGLTRSLDVSNSRRYDPKELILPSAIISVVECNVAGYSAWDQAKAAADCKRERQLLQNPKVKE